MTQTLQQHPLSSAFPAMYDADFQALKDSITVLGVQNPITLYEGMVLDGWHRYRAAVELGMDCPGALLPDVDPRDFVMAQNKARRHITVAQLAMAAQAVYQWQRGRPAIKSALSAEFNQQAIAAKTGVGVRSLRQAAQVAQSASPEVLAAIGAGQVGLPKAAAISQLPRSEQAQALKPKPRKPKAEPVPEVKELEEPDYTELGAAQDQVAELQAELVVARMASEHTADQQQAANLIADLRAQVKSLTAQLRAITLSRDTLTEENAQMKRQMAQQRKELSKLRQPEPAIDL